ncbi:MAG: hypothetical protein HC902_06740 [Calothrix sp. SM1_5_4]|nr:hypothetical protein [Calothrix sp. SM1_5_4]
MRARCCFNSIFLCKLLVPLALTLAIALALGLTAVFPQEVAYAEPVKANVKGNTNTNTNINANANANANTNINTNTNTKRVRRPVRRKTSYTTHSLQISAATWSEKSDAVLGGYASRTAMSVYGVHLGYSLRTRTFGLNWAVEPFAEVLTGTLSDQSSAIEFKQSNIPIYAGGMNFSILLRSSRAGSVIGLTTRGIYRIAAVKLTSSEDTFAHRERILISEGLSLGWALSSRWLFTQFVGLSLNGGGAEIQAGLQWRFL